MPELPSPIAIALAPFSTSATPAEARAKRTRLQLAAFIAGCVAAALLALIQNEAAEAFLGFPERLAVRLNGLLGALLDGSFAKHRRSLQAAPAEQLNPGTTP